MMATVEHPRNTPRGGGNAPMYQRIVKNRLDAPLSSLRKQGPITTGCCCQVRCLPAHFNCARRGVWVPAQGRDDGATKLTLNSYARSPPTSVSLSAAPSGLTPGGRPSSSNAKRFTPGGPCSTSFGTGNAQSGVGPSTNRLTF